MVYDTTIHIFDMNTKSFTSNALTLLLKTEHCGCLASTGSLTDGQLYVAGGISVGNNDELQIYNISSSSWSYGPSMNKTRYRLSCHIENNRLYAISGKNEASIEWISISNINSNSWSLFSSTLPYSLEFANTVSYDNDIYIIGGSPNSRSDDGETVFIIDTTSNTYSSSSDTLIEGIGGSAALYNT